jgi:hypothetical protein
MGRLLLAVFLTALAALAANVKLYMKDGSFHVVREYEVQPDRVRYYSVERSEWEEVPLELVDLKRTQSEASARREELEKEAKVLSEEDRVEREQKKEITRIPQDPGVYWRDGSKTYVLKLAEAVVHTSKGRSVLKMLSPIPVVPGKGTLELSTPNSANVFTNPEQEFYIQLSQLERFGIIKLQPGKGVRIVEKLTFMPVTKEVLEEPEQVPIFTRQLTPDGLYRIWPKEPLPPGEYAVMQWTEGKLNMQIWDFAIKAAQ